MSKGKERENEEVLIIVFFMIITIFHEVPLSLSPLFSQLKTKEFFALDLISVANITLSFLLVITFSLSLSRFPSQTWPSRLSFFLKFRSQIMLPSLSLSFSLHIDHCPQKDSNERFIFFYLQLFFRLSLSL